MDPLSITAGTLAFLGALTTTGKGIHKLLSLRKAPSELQALSNEVEALRQLLLIVEVSLRRVHGSQAYRDCEEALSVILRANQDSVLELHSFVEYQLKRSEELHETGLPKVSPSQWLKARPKLDSMRDKIRDSRDNLTASLGALNLQTSEQVRQSALQYQSFAIEVDGLQQDRFQSLEASIKQVSRTNEARIKPVQRIHEVSDAAEPMHIAQGESTTSRPSPPSISLTQSAKQVASQESGASSSTRKQTNEAGAVRVTASMSLQGCPHACKCSCHVQSFLQTPRFLRNIVGQLLLSYTSLLHVKPCDYPPCRKNPTKTQFTYYFPQLLLKRAMVASGFSDCLTGPNSSWAVKIPVVMLRSHPLWHAAANGKLEFLRRYFSSRGNTPFIIDEWGQNLLHIAMDSLETTTYRFLLKLGISDTWEDCSRESPRDKILANHLYRDLGYDLDTLTDHASLPPLHLAVIAASSGKDSLHQTLLNEYSNIDRPDHAGRTALQWAIMSKDLSACEKLVEWNANVNCRNLNGASALHTACAAGAEYAALLLNAGCEVGTLDLDGCNALFYARSPEVVDLLFRHGLDVECHDKYGQTPLFKAVIHDEHEVMERLLEGGANKYAVDSQGLDLLSTAIAYDRPSCLRALLKHHKATGETGIWTVTHKKSNALHLAALYGSVTILETLTDADLAGLSPLARNAQGRSPTDDFFTRRGYNCIAPRRDFLTELNALEGLMRSACRQNGIDFSLVEDEIAQFVDYEESDSVTTISESGSDEDETDSDDFVDACEETTVK